MEEFYGPFMALPGARAFFLGCWALAVVVSLPFCWSWDDHAGWPEDGGEPKVDFGPLGAGLLFPIWPLVVLSIPLALVALLLAVGAPYYVRRWWNADWSRR